MSQMTTDAKKALSTTIRGLRERLLTDLNASLDRTYLLAVPTQSAQLNARAKMGRQRLEGWWTSQPDPARARRDTVLRVASTWLNRLVLLRVLEAREEGRRPVITGGWQSRAYKDFRELAPALCKDDSQGMQPLLDMVFGELALDLPGLYGPIDLLPLVPMPPATLRVLIESLDSGVLQSCWTDDLTLGWVYQYWNDPAREALDAKLNSGGKVENHEIASKTQMFTERYMVDWLLQNSVNPLWLAICQKNDWTPEAESTGLLDRLDARKASFRKDREDGTVSDTALMPLYDDEHHWAYTLRQPIPQDAVDTAPSSIRDVRILDPALGSGHFLVVAFDLLVSLYHEEARHRRVVGDPDWTDTAIAERIVSHNLAGIDLDPRAVQIAAASLWLKARLAAPNVRPSRLNLVAANLGLGSLSADDRQRLLDAVYNETDLPTKLMGDVVDALADADHLGSLLQVDSAVRDAVFAQGGDADADGGSQILMLASRKGLTTEEAVNHVHMLLQQFLAKHTGTADLGLRLHGEQLAAGVRFVELVREGTWDVVVGNPPYQGTAKMKDSTYIAKTYPKGKADLYAAFLERGLQLVRPGDRKSVV